MLFEFEDLASGSGFLGFINSAEGASATGMKGQAGESYWRLGRSRESPVRGFGSDLKRVWGSYRGRHEVRDGDQREETVNEGNEQHPTPE